MGKFHYIDGIPYRMVLDRETGATVLEPVPSEARKNNAKRRKDNRREAKLDREWAEDDY